ncbi:hypothetical protein P168DRAFT_330530 [Aspergillus campestris IBT 28561]|uniref:Zn(2)-C6 fungal-type domain-containing protein n=1 Tax=Aspergillus campestris (strain IBT 28561) TaxID=1392248 RepID=A0A2I1CRQ7_ASPC2|nr:uncharacterized protein P168DRAFT_330530 [Aspergillus campestris IBT 28561]PKY00316.1 hypothetical protein P168DRAFT_330530 [Aspergillus campestris IBT 28561]
MSQSYRRKRGPISKGGCSTCKFRHVKCGEEKPECVQCTSTGRKCAGYENLSQSQLRQRVTRSNLRPSPSTDTQIVLLPGTREEREHFHLFCTETIQSLSGFFGSELWEYYLPQISQSDGAIRHAITAISAAHRRRLQSPTGREPPHPFELQQYNKAIHHLLNRPSVSSEHTLLACSLFVCLEFLKLNFEPAMEHVEAGLRILCQRQQQQAPSQLPPDVDRDLSHFFSRMNLQISFWARPLSPYEAPVEPRSTEETAFTSLAEARAVLNRIMISSMVLIRLSMRVQQNESLVPDHEAHRCAEMQQQLERQYNSWWVAFERMKKRLSRSKKRAPDPRAVLVIQVHHQTLRFWTLGVQSTSEMVYDNFNDEFEKIVGWSEEIKQLSSADHQRPFLLETDIAPALYLTARKCRHPLIRRRAIELLEQCPIQEGLWNTKENSAIATYTMELEEAFLAHLPVEQRVPEEQHRLYETRTMDVGLCNPCPVEFVWRSKDGTGLEFRTEFVSW